MSKANERKRVDEQGGDEAEYRDAEAEQLLKQARSLVELADSVLEGLAHENGCTPQALQEARKKVKVATAEIMGTEQPAKKSQT